VENPVPDGYTVSYTYQEAGETSDYATHQYGPGVHRGGTIYINNTMDDFTMKVKKVIKDTDIGLENATFTLTKVDEQGAIITGDNAYSQEQTTSDANNKIITFDSLKPGNYMLSETGMPAGYIKREGPYYINIGATGTIALKDSDNYSLISPGSEGVTFIIENEPGTELPAAGGPGTRLFVILGGLFLALAGAGIVLMTRRNAKI